MISAIEFGERHCSCPEAVMWRCSLGSDATQADAWRFCKRGDWLLWQLRKGLSLEQYAILRPVIDRAGERTVVRAIRRGIRSLRGVRAQWATTWRCWARRWLSGEDRSAAATVRAREVAWAARADGWKAALAARVARAALGVDAPPAWAAWAVWATNVAAAELRFQARDIHREIPEWPGEE